MALVLANRVRETTSTTGTGSVTLGGAYTSFQTFLAGVGNGNTTYYTISNAVTGEWEVGLGTYTSSGNTLSRDTVFASSNSGSLVNFVAGTKDVFVTQPAERAVYVNSTNTQVSVPQLAATSITDSGNLTFTGTGNRITGDFSNATQTNRVAFQTSTTNGASALTVIPNGTATQSSINLFDNSDPTNAGLFNILSNSSEKSLRSTITGTGTYLPMTFHTGGSERMRIDTSGNVGIGTSSPSSYGSPLSVYAATNPTLAVVSGNANAYLRLYSTSDNNMYLTNTGGSMTMNTANTERMRIDSSGNVGIGTAGGTYGLALNRSSNNGSTIQINNSTLNASFLLQVDTAGTAYVQQQYAGALAFATSNSEKMRIDSSGNVGIGQTSQVWDEKLGVRLAASGSGTVGLGVYSASTTYTSSMIRVQAETGGSGWKMYEGRANGGSQLFWVDGSGGAYFAGNVGIGTSSPGYKLDIQSSSATLNLQSTTTTSLSYLTLRNVGFNYVGVENSAGGGLFTGSSAYALALGTVSAYPIQFGTSGTIRATIDSSGNVGIGTTTFTYTPKLQVNGANVTVAGRYGVQNIMSTDAFAIDKGGSLAFGGKYATDGSYEIFGQISGRKESAGDGAYTGYLAFATGATMTERMRIDSSGNVGIGTSSPATRLNVSYDVAGNTPYLDAGTTVLITNVNATGSAGIKLKSGATAYPSYITYDVNSGSSAALVFYDRGANAERMRIDSSGNLLVGTTNSSITAGTGMKFDLNGTNPQIAIVGTETTSAQLTYSLYSSGASAYRFYVNYAGTIFATSTTISAISDQRLKENIRDLDDGLDKILALKPRKFDWKEGKGANIKDARGFIAQEFESVFPDMIEEWKDPAPEGEEPYKAVNANLIPTLVKAIQEQQALITQLQADISTLKGKK